MSRDQAILRWINTETLSPADRSMLAALLDDEETDRARWFRLDEDRWTFIAAHALARMVLFRLARRPARSWRYREGRFGKPEPVLAPGDPPVTINLSHTRGLAIVAASIGHRVGVDAEWIGRDAPLDVADHCFAPEERTYLFDCAEAERREGFFRTWTIKEAYMKATGKGMSLAPDSFAFGFDPVRLLRSGTSRSGTNWYFRQSKPDADHVIALAVGLGDADRLLISERPVNPEEIARMRHA